MITDRDTNMVYFSKRITWYNVWKHLDPVLRDKEIRYDFIHGTKDIWARDYMPIQLEKNRFVEYVYNPDYLLDDPKRRTDLSVIDKGNLPLSDRDEKTALIIDGGNVIKCDDAVIMTDKVFLENRRLNLSRKEVVNELERLFGKVIIIPWNIQDEWDFCGHADGMVRYIGNNKVLVNNMCNHPELAWQRKEVMSAIEDAGMDVLELDYGHNSTDVNDWAYLNYLRVGDVIFMPTVGRPDTDHEAARQIAEASGCEVVPVPALSLVRANGKYGGGALNCISWTVSV